MKVKLDFVTNSSSTGFYFIFKGPPCIKPLKEAIQNHKESFKLSFNSWGDVATFSCNYADIIENIEDVVKASLGRKKWQGRVKVVPIDEGIKELDHIISQEEKGLKDPTNSESLKKIIREQLSGYRQRRRTFQQSKKKGFVNLLKMNWGDNDGDISGGNTGNAMDYSGKDIKIDSEDLIVFTESEH